VTDRGVCGRNYGAGVTAARELPVFVVVRGDGGGGHELAVRLKLLEKLGESQPKELVAGDTHTLREFVGGRNEMIRDGDV
jgi:hypothetical protein